MAKDKKVLITILGDFDYRLSCYLLKLRADGVSITKAQLLVLLADEALKARE